MFRGILNRVSMKSSCRMLLPMVMIAVMMHMSAVPAHAVSCSASSGTPNWINVMDCSPAPDPTGATDSTAVFQAAFNSIDTYHGGTVYCPPGKYLINSGITVNREGVQFIGDSGPSVYESYKNTRGCTLFSTTTTSGYALLTFTPGNDSNLGPVIEYVNFRDEANSGAGGVATLLTINNYQNWTVRNVAVNYGLVGLALTGGSSGSAQGGYVAQLMCYYSNTCIQQASNAGGFTAVGGRYQALATSGGGANDADIVLAGSGAKIIGVKVDCWNGSTGGAINGINITGSDNVVIGTAMEQCVDGVNISGSYNAVIGSNFSTQNGDNSSTGVNIASGTDNQSIGNSYSLTGTSVGTTDNGTGTAWSDSTTFGGVSCGASDQMINMVVKNGVVTAGTCN